MQGISIVKSVKKLKEINILLLLLRNFQQKTNDPEFKLNRQHVLDC